MPFGFEANRKPLELIVDYAFQQSLIPRRYAVEDLFDETTRGLN
ncbi:serine/threonine protein kinase HipA of HipAB toxin-antitoxin module [Bradyrhizobium sp. LB7.2]